MFLSKNGLSFLTHIADKEAKKSTFKLKLGAVIFSKKQIISVGNNKNKSHPLARKYFKFGTVHAEVDALLKAPKNKLENSSIFVYRTTKKGNPAMGKPCPQCTQILFNTGVKRAYWTTPQFPFWDSAKIKDLYDDIKDKEYSFLLNKWS